MARVKNKIALVTGGARGIGAATAKLLAAEGALVIIADILDEAGRATVQQIIGDSGGQARYLHLDVAQESDWQAACDLIRREHGRLDILFNNAGIAGFDEKFAQRPQDVEHVSLADWHLTHAINLDGVLLGCKYGIALMKAHGGSIINMSSRSGMVGSPGDAAYSSSKGAVRNLTKSVALYCAQNGYRIRCNSLHPGAIYSPIWDGVLGATPAQREQTLAFIKRGIPLGEMGTPTDVAYNVLYLASDESRYLTGSEMVIDGGIMSGSTAMPQVSEPDETPTGN
jgi:3(or 17)beta-hydroxysteroid dehydrogenase